MSDKMLVGRRAIARYCRRGWQTVKTWIKDEAFPAMVIDGVWTSYADLVDDWLQGKIEKATQPNDWQ